MKKFYLSALAVTLAAASVVAAPTARSIVSANQPITHKAPAKAASENPFQITDLDKQVMGRYALEYYSPIPNPEDGNKPFGNCYEQPMIVEDYFAEKEGDVNIGYLFLLNAIIKGHVDKDAGTISIPSRFACVYYVDPDDYNDPGLDIYFTAVDYVDGKYQPNRDRPFTGTFELHDGKITKIVTDDIWGYIAYDVDGKFVGWMEIGVNSRFYLGHGEMEYWPGDVNGDGVVNADDKEQTIVHAISDGKKVTIYNAFRSGWDNPITVDIDDAAKKASIKDQNITIGGVAAALTTETHEAAIEGLIRDVSWDVDKRDDNPNSVLDFGTIIAHDKAAAKDLFKYESVRFYCKENVAVDNAGVAEIVIDDENAPVEFYNLNGVRINSDNLVPGLYIRRQGAKASKIIVR
ncbi:MAG: hypothetical protein PUH83_06535 [Bacteroidales bacterium]|nr:hypothetical protein [Bacteroidales bacterium]MDY5227604.1 hypothetical protein [Sodaliphilus sp.]MDD7137836.1 hypothetical protein [Bacteroidales bacterium]MDY5381291.1 hypothetical protein [Sodaliphilus sp.]MDY5446790.1 hypothetical protein [Sodaliphilus sp.]